MKRTIASPNQLKVSTPLLFLLYGGVVTISILFDLRKFPVVTPKK